MVPMADALAPAGGGSCAGVRTADAMHALWWSARSRLSGGVRRRTASVVELVGPPGVGKTTIRRELLALEPGSRTIRVDRQRELGAVVHAALGLVLPIAVERARHRPSPSWADAVQLVRLRALRPAVAREAAGAARLVLLDEGPVYALAKLQAYARAAEDDGFFGARWRDALARWRQALDVVVWLDAPDELLMQRIRTRAKSHRVKAAGDLETARFLARYRAAYDTVVARLCTAGGPRLLRIDTTSGTGAEQAANLLQALDVRRRTAGAAGEWTT